MIRDWAQDLRDLGFRLETHRGQTSFHRDRGPLRQMVFETHEKYDRGLVRVDLVIGLLDPFRRDEAKQVQWALRGWLRPEGGVGLVYGSEPPGRMWWKVTQDAEALQAFRTHGLNWLDEHGAPERLMALLEQQLAHGIAPAPVAGGWVVNRLVSAIFPNARKALPPPVNHDYLALL